MPTGVYGRTKEHKRRISIGLKEWLKDENVRRRLSLAMTGRKLSEEHRKKISKAQKGRKHHPQEGFQKGHVVSKETREKLTMAGKGRRVSEETKKKLSKINRGSNHPMWGKPKPEHVRKKISNTKIKQYKTNPEIKIKIRKTLKKLWEDPEFRRKYSGSNSPNWKGGLTKRHKSLAYALRAELRNWAKKILERDNYICQECGKGFKEKRVMEVHHIKSVGQYPYLVLDVLNGITLCSKCHRKTESYGRKIRK